MAHNYELPRDFIPGQIAAADLSALQYTFVNVSATGIAANTSSGAQVDGVLQNKPTAGQAASVATGGVVKMKAGAAVAAGARVMSDTTGRAITATATNYARGKALTAAGAANQYISVCLDIGIGTV